MAGSELRSDEPFSDFALKLTDRRWREVVQRALDFTPQAPDWVGELLRRALRKHVKVPGSFRDPNLAPRSRLLRETVRACKFSSRVFAAVVGAWLESHGELEAAVRGFLGKPERSIHVEDLFSVSVGRVQQMAQSFCLEHAQYDEDDVLLMLWCIKGVKRPGQHETDEMEAAGDPADEALSSKEPEVTIVKQSPKWEVWLDELRALPPEASEWDTIGEFLEAVRVLSEERRHQRDAGRAKLREVLAAFFAEAAEPIMYFERQACLSWSADNCPASECGERAQQVDGLKVAMLRHALLREQPCRTMAEERNRRDEMARLEREIEEAYEKLLPVFTPSPACEGVPEPPAAAPVVQSTALIGQTDESQAPIVEPADVPEVTASTPEAEAKEIPEEEVEIEQAREETTEVVTSPASVIEPIAPRDVQGPKVDAEWATLLWSLLQGDDLSGAYWLVKSLKAHGQEAGVGDWLLAAVQGARWLGTWPDLFASDLLALASEHQPGAGHVEELLGLAAALAPSLSSPGSGLIGWLKRPSCCSALHRLTEAVRTYASYGIGLRPEDLLGVAGAEKRNQLIREAAGAAREWIESAPQKKTQMGRANEVWLRLVRDELRALLVPAADDRRDEAEEVRARVSEWENRDTILDRIKAVDLELARRRVRPIVGAPRDKILRDFMEGCEVARRWCDLVRREREILARGDWLFDRVAKLRDELRETLPVADKALDEMAADERTPHLGASAACLQRAVRQVARITGLSQDGERETNRWACLAAGADTLDSALARRLLWLPEVELEDDGQPTAAGLRQVATALRAAAGEERSLLGAHDGWVRREDYRFLDSIQSMLPSAENTPALASRVQEAREASRSKLIEERAKTIERIEQAVVDGIIFDERSEYESIVAAVNPDQTLNVAARLRSLEAVRNCLAEALETRLEGQRQHWSALQEQLAASRLPADLRENVRTRIEQTIEGRDTRLLDEFLAQVRESLEAGTELPVSWTEPQRERDVLEEYLRLLAPMEELLRGGLNPVLRMLRQGDWPPPSLPFPRNMPTPRLMEAAAALEAWAEMRRSRPGARDIVHHIETLLRFVGFSVPQPAARPITLQQEGADWVHFRARMTDGRLSPVPQFGSQAADQYDVVCVWERPGVDTIRSWLEELRLDDRPVLLVYLARLSGSQRRNLTRMLRRGEMSVLTLDETLLLFLAGERDARLPVFLRCALPYALVNPFTPFQAGDVPREMFFGRKGMVRELQRAEGSCLVYGGRQLGKSALLRQVQRDFHNPTLERYCCLIDIKLVGDRQAGQDTEMLWRRLRDALREAGVLSSKITADRPQTIDRAIRDSLTGAPTRRILVLFDEADNFLDADAKENFKVVTGLRDLMTWSGRRFKAVFAGLHNVQRFQGIPNQPLAHFGRPLLVGPLEADAAYRLVEEPFQHLGYRFDSTGTVLRILSYTNYHPGLIQLFCQTLLKRLQQRGTGETPPYPIHQADVEAVYRDQQVRESIRERLDWTLALDPRYQAVAWAMIVDQSQARDGYAKAYPAGELLGNLRGWWPAGFGAMSSDDLRGWLDEMCGLGVLIRNADGHYRLRSPNLVRLMGRDEDIANRLLELSERQPPAVFEADSHHAPLDELGVRYSPLTHSQERRLGAPQFGVGLVFASPALGLSGLADALARFVPAERREGQPSACSEIPSDRENAGELKGWLRAYLRERSGEGGHVVYQRFTEKSTAMPERVEAAIQFCQERARTGRQWMRVAFLFDPPATWEWLSAQRAVRERLEGKVDAALSPQRWNRLGIRQRLEQQQKLSPEEVLSLVLKVTGGWPWLVDLLFDRAKGTDDIRPTAAALERELADPGGALAGEFRARLGLDGIDPALRVLKAVCTFGELAEAEVVPDLIEGGPVLAADECGIALEFLVRMGCVERRETGVLVPDSLVARLLA